MSIEILHNYIETIFQEKSTIMNLKTYTKIASKYLQHQL